MNNQKTTFQLPDPFGDSATSPDFRLNVNVMTEDILLIQSVAPSRGTKQHLVASYVKSLAAELRAHGITYYSPDNFRKFLAIVERRNKWDLPGTTTPSTSQPQSSGNVGCGTQGVCNNPPNPAKQRTSTSRKGRTRGEDQHNQGESTAG